MSAAPSSNPAGRSRIPGRTQLILLAVLFLSPFVSSWLLYFYFPDHRPSGTTNYGDLVTPLKTLPEWVWLKPDGTTASTTELRGKWTLIQYIAGPCDESCLARILLTRQLHTALGAERDHVQRLLLVDDAAALASLQQQLATEHSDLILRAPTATSAIDPAFFGHHGDNALYLVDPAGNYLMAYPDQGTQQDFKGMQKDFKKLLRLSQSG